MAIPAEGNAYIDVSEDGCINGVWRTADFQVL